MTSLDQTMDSEHTKVHAISSVVVATIISIGVIIAAVILAGGDYGRDNASQCVSNSGGGTLKAMTNNMVMNVMMMNDNTEIGMQRARYDYDANTILVEAPAITGGFNNASMAIDYDKSLVFIHIHDGNVCYASSLMSGDMMDMTDRFVNFMTDNEKKAIDIADSEDVEMNYQALQVIPAGYVTNSNGPIIRALCAGDVSHWTEPRMTQARKKRRSGLASARFCIFGFCFNFNF